MKKLVLAEIFFEDKNEELYDNYYKKEKEFVDVDFSLKTRTRSTPTIVLLEEENGRYSLIRKFFLSFSSIKTLIDESDQYDKISKVIGSKYFANVMGLLFDTEFEETLDMDESRINENITCILTSVESCVVMPSYDKIKDFINTLPLNVKKEFSSSFLNLINNNNENTPEALELISCCNLLHLKFKSLFDFAIEHDILKDLESKLLPIIKTKSVSQELIYVLRDKKNNYLTTLIEADCLALIEKISKVYFSYIKKTVRYNGLEPYIENEELRKYVDFSELDQNRLKYLYPSYLNILGVQQEDEITPDHKYYNYLEQFKWMCYAHNFNKCLMFITLADEKDFETVCKVISENFYCCLSINLTSRLEIDGITETYLKNTYMDIKYFENNIKNLLNGVANIIEGNKNKRAVDSLLKFFDANLIFKYIDFKSKPFLKKQLMKYNLSY